MQKVTKKIEFVMHENNICEIIINENEAKSCKVDLTAKCDLSQKRLYKHTEVAKLAMIACDKYYVNDLYNRHGSFVFSTNGSYRDLSNDDDIVGAMAQYDEYICYLFKFPLLKLKVGQVFTYEELENEAK